jgi:predicted PurR-regulated permease PerM
MDNKVVSIMGGLVIAFVVLAASSMAQVVFEPVIFAIFIIALIWPLQKALVSRMPKALALLITIVLTLGVVVALTSMIVRGAGEIADWIRHNLLKIVATFRNSTKYGGSRQNVASQVRKFRCRLVDRLSEDSGVKGQRSCYFLLVFIFLIIPCRN